MIFKNLPSTPFFFASLGTALALCLSQTAQAQARLTKDVVTVSAPAIKTSAPMDLRRTAKLDLVNESSTALPNTHANANADAGSTVGMAAAELQDTYWKLVELGGLPVTMLPRQEREVRITLTSTGQQLRGFSGCNALGGAYAQNGASLKFDPLASSMRLCEPAHIALERQVLDALLATHAPRINGEQLSLLASDRVLARFEAVYLK